MIEQQFGRIELNDDTADAMMCVDRDEPNVAMIYWWSQKIAPEGILCDLRKAGDGSLDINWRAFFKTDEQGRFKIERNTPDLTERLSQYQAKLKPSGRGFKGAWAGPGGSGAIKFRPKRNRQPPPVHQCLSWSDFKEWVSISRSMHDLVCYRGHGDSRFKLATSFHRNGKQRLDRFIYGDLTSFHDQAQTFLNRPINLQDGNDYSTLLALAQHHGLPTPLLDATRSPYIAAFFAFSDFLDNLDHRKPRPTHVRIYGFSRYFLDLHTPASVALHFPMPYISRLRVSGIHNPRLSAQQGEFLVTNIVEIEQTIHELEENRGQIFMVAADIPTSFAIEALEDLSFMGLTPATMFPGLDGICRMLKHQSHFVRRPLESVTEYTTENISKAVVSKM